MWLGLLGMIKAIFWLALAYVFGVLGFGLASLMSAYGTTDLAVSFSDALAFGLKWPSTVIDLLTGDLKR